MITVSRYFDEKQVPFPPLLIQNEIDNLLKKNPTPLFLEIGCGVGMHPIIFSKQNPEITLIAVEHTKEKFIKFIKRIQDHQKKSIQLQNLIPVHTNAISLVTHLIPNNSLDKIFLLYPNPNLKNKSKRWFCMPFFNKLIQTLKPGATIELRTNLEWYAQEAISQSNNSNNKKERSNLLLVKYEKFSNPKNDSTHFEKKYLLTGQLCYQLIFMKPKKDQIT